MHRLRENISLFMRYAFSLPPISFTIAQNIQSGPKSVQTMKMREAYTIRRNANAFCKVFVCVCALHGYVWVCLHVPMLRIAPGDIREKHSSRNLSTLFAQKLYTRSMPTFRQATTFSERISDSRYVMFLVVSLFTDKQRYTKCTLCARPLWQYNVE